jgi:hypothetical protein
MIAQCLLLPEPLPQPAQKDQAHHCARRCALRNVLATLLSSGIAAPHAAEKILGLKPQLVTFDPTLVWPKGLLMSLVGTSRNLYAPPFRDRRPANNQGRRGMGGVFLDVSFRTE